MTSSLAHFNTPVLPHSQPNLAPSHLSLSSPNVSSWLPKRSRSWPTLCSLPRSWRCWHLRSGGPRWVFKGVCERVCFNKQLCSHLDIFGTRFPPNHATNHSMTPIHTPLDNCLGMFSLLSTPWYQSRSTTHRLTQENERESVTQLWCPVCLVLCEMTA